MARKQIKLRKATLKECINYKLYPSKSLYVNVFRIGKRRKYIDDKGQMYVKVNGMWYKFPQEIDF